MAIGEVLVRVAADTKQFQKGMEGASDKVEGFAKKATGMSLVAAKAFTGLAVASAAGIGVIVNSASKFEDAMANVRKTTDLTDKEFGVLTKEIREMAKVMPETALEIAGVAAAAGQLGIEKDKITDFTKNMVLMGVATNMSSEEAAIALARLSAITGTSMDDMDKLGSTIVNLGNNTAATEKDITNMGLRLAGAGNQIGMTEAEILSFSAAMLASGIRVEAGGSSMSRVFRDINTAVISGGKELTGFAKVAGMSTADFKQAFEKDAAGAITTFIEGLGKITDSGGDVTATLQDLGLGNDRVIDTMLRMSGAGDLLANTLDLGRKGWEENKALVEEYLIKSDTLSARLAIIKNNVIDLAYAIGGPMIEVLKDWLDALSPLIGKMSELTESFGNLSDEQQYSIAKWILLVPAILGAVAALFSSLAVIGLLVQGFALVKAGAAAIGFLVKPLLAFAGAILGWWLLIPVVAGLAWALIKNWDLVKAKTLELVNFMGNKLEELANIVSEKSAKIWENAKGMLPESVVTFLQGVWAMIQDVFANAMTVIQNALTGDTEAISTIFAKLIPSIVAVLYGGIPRLIAVGLLFLPTLAEAITDNIDDIVRVSSEVLNTIITTISEGLPLLLEAGVGIIEKLLLGITDSAPKVIETLLALVVLMINTISELYPEIVGAGIMILETIIEGITTAMPQIIETITMLISVLILTFAEMMPLILETGVTLLETIVNGIIEALPKLIEMGIGIIYLLIDTVIGLLPVIIETGIDILLALIEGIINALPDLIDAVIVLIGTILETIVVNLPAVLEAGSKILLMLIKGIVKTVPQLLGAVFVLMAKLIITIGNNLPKLLAMGVKLLWALIKGIVQTGGQLLGAAYDLMANFLVKIGLFVPKLLNKGVELINSLIDGILSMVSKTGSSAKKVGKSALNGIKSFWKDMKGVGGNLISGLISGISGMKNRAIAKAKEVGSAIKNTLTSFFGIKSPSRVMRNEVGAMLGRGLVDGMSSQITAIQRMATKVSEAATPDQPQLAGFNVNDFQGTSQKLSAQLQAEVSRGDYDTSRDIEAQRGDNLTQAINDLRRDMTNLRVEMDGKVVGRLAEPHVTEAQSRNKRIKDSFS